MRCGCPLGFARLWSRCLSSTIGVKFSCICLMILCIFISLTGRGVVSIIQSIIGIIFAIEGFWGAVKHSSDTLRKFLLFLVVYFFLSVAISIFDIQTLSSYCSSADTIEQEATCKQQTRIYSYITLCVSCGLVPFIFVLSLVFYLRLLKMEQQDKYSRKHQQRQQQQQHSQLSQQHQSYRGINLAQQSIQQSTQAFMQHSTIQTH